MITSVVSGPRKPNTGYDIEEVKIRGLGVGNQWKQAGPIPVPTAPPHPLCP